MSRLPGRTEKSFPLAKPHSLVAANGALPLGIEMSFVC